MQGIEENVKLVASLYGEEWTVRLYYRSENNIIMVNVLIKPL